MIQKIYESRDALLEISAGISIFSSEINNFCYISNVTYLHISHFYKSMVSWCFQGVQECDIGLKLVNKRCCNFDDVSKFGYSRLSWNKVILDKGYDVVISAHDVTSKILSGDSNYVVDVVMLSSYH